MNFYLKLKFFFKKPKLIIIVGEGKTLAFEAIMRVLSPYLKIGEEILVFKADLTSSKSEEKFRFFIKNSSLPILVATQVGQIPPDFNFFSGEKEETERIRKLIEMMPSFGYLILNFDDEVIRELSDLTNLKILSFGFQEGANLRASDVKINYGTNFKINYKGNIIPIWLEKLFGKEQIYSVLSASSVGVILGLNFVEIAERLKDYHSLPGKMRLVKGIKDSYILDNSEPASLFSIIESLKILEKITGEKRRIAVLGDILGIGKYAIEAHEKVGAEIKKIDLLFTLGPRAKFIAQGAIEKGFLEEKIFQFEEISALISVLKKEIKKEDLILIAGSKEMNMGEIVKEIEAV